MENSAKNTDDKSSDEIVEQTKIASDTGRKLAFGAAAVAWAFTSVQATSPKVVLFSMFCIALFGLIDVAQYLLSIAGELAYVLIFKPQSKPVNDAAGLEFKDKIRWITYVCFFLKFLFLFFAYAGLGIEFVQKITRHL